MTDKELKKLNRMELLEVLVEQSRELDELREQLNNANEKLDSRNIAISKVGSIAEASMLLNDVFASAQKAADEYLQNVKSHNFSSSDIEENVRNRTAEMIIETENKCKKAEAETIQRCKKMEAETIQKCKKMEAETMQKCKEMVRLTEIKAREYLEKKIRSQMHSGNNN